MVSSERVWTSKAWMYRQYIVNKLKEQEIAELAKTDQSTISRWLKRHGLK